VSEAPAPAGAGVEAPGAARVQAPAGTLIDAPLTLLAPVYHEQENLPGLVAEVERCVPAPFTLLLVHDTDDDPTVPVARTLAASRPWMRIVKNDVGRGVANALRAGFAAAGDGPIIVVMADLSDDLSVVPAMLALYRGGARIVCASRHVAGGGMIGGPRLKRTLSRWAGRSLHALRGFPSHDVTNNFRLYDGALVRELGIESEAGFAVAIELTVKAFRRRESIAEIPTTWRDRVAGASRFRLLRWLPGYLRWYLLAFLPRSPPRRRDP
jgi:dolichol-phosphate mannosyltransferase